MPAALLRARAGSATKRFFAAGTARRIAVFRTIHAEISADLAARAVRQTGAFTAAIVHARLIRQDNEFGLSELELEDQPLFVTAVNASIGASIRLRLPARDVSLCLEAPSNTSILNVFKARVTDIENSSASRVLVRLQTGKQFLLARVTRKSIASLQLTTGDTVYAQVKSVALLSQIRD